MDVWERPTSTITDRYHSLGLSPRWGTGLQEMLLKRSPIVSCPIVIGRSRIKVLALTGAGKAALGIDEPDADRLGGPEHRYWKKRLADHLRASGYDVTEEYPVGGGKTIDLVAERDGRRFAFEVETGKSDAASNVRKCLDAGIGNVVAVATSEDARRTLERRLRRRPGVGVFTPDEALRRFAGRRNELQSGPPSCKVKRGSYEGSIGAGPREAIMDKGKIATGHGRRPHGGHWAPLRGVA